MVLRITLGRDAPSPPEGFQLVADPPPPPPGFSLVPQAPPPPPPGFQLIEPAADSRSNVSRETEPASPEHSSYFGRVTDIWQDFKDIVGEGAHKIASAPGQFAAEHAQRGPELAGATVGERMKLASKPGMAPMNLLGGFFDILSSPAKAPVRSMVTRPIAEDIQRKPESYEAPVKKFMQMTGIGGDPERVDFSGARPQDVEMATDLLLPGFGLVSYGKTGAALKTVGKGIEKALSPTTVDAHAGVAEDLLRRAGGGAARDTATVRADMDPFHKTINQLPDIDRFNFIDHVEGGPGQIQTLPQPLRDLAGKMRDAFQLRAAKLAALPSTSQMQFIADYFPHFWQDPGAAQQFAQNFAGRGGAGKQGSGASLHKRSIPTVADGVRAGLVPITTDPIEATMRYVASMDRFIAAQTVLDTAKGLGHVRYIKPKVMGASGHPSSFKVPPGWVAINGRGARNAMGAQAYAPEGFARVYNNFIDRGIHEKGDVYGNAYDVAQRASNAVTALELGMSGFHAVTMANEASISKLAQGIGDIVGGAKGADWRRVLRGTGAVVSAPAAPVTSYLKGKGLEKVYLGRNPGSPDMARITDLLEKAGGRAKGAEHARDYQFSAMGSYLQSVSSRAP